ncbi:LPD11 domain-containing protein [Paenibacillus dendritiformis]|uniref:LPD11 domain-containing protein n=1 Tax=Paenibacillus dendritiformis TaxID=130049 RepID=UPI00387E0BD9
MNGINENIRTMEFIGTDNWNRPVYKCIENEVLWKDITLGSENPELCSCGNDFDGEPDSPIKKELIVVFKSKYKENPYVFNYMMLDRLRSDCDTHLAVWNKYRRQLKEDEIKSTIEEMKKLYNSLPHDAKPEWLTWDDILNYEKLMK